MRTTVAATTTTSRSDDADGASRRESLRRSSQAGSAGLSFRAVGGMLLLLIAGIFCLHCSRCDSKPEANPPPSPKPPPATLPLPLLGSLVIGEPQSLWSVLRRVSGAWGAALPTQAALGLAGGLGLPTLMAGSFDLASPVVGAVMVSASKEPIVVLAVHVTSGRELVAQLTSGKAPPFAGKRLEYGVTVLERVNEHQRAFPLCVYKNYLVVGSSAETVCAAARFLVERLAQQKPPAGLLVMRAEQRSLQGPLSDLLQARWAAYHQQLRAAEKNARAVKGRPPDFANPAAVMGALGTFVDALLALLATTKEATVRLDVNDDDWSVHVEATPMAKGAFAELLSDQSVGTAKPLNSLPAETVVALLSRSDEAARATSAKDVASQLKAMLEDRLTADDQATLVNILDAWAHGRGDVTKIAFIAGKASGVVVSGSVNDAARLKASLEGLPKALGVPAISEPVANLLGPVHQRPVVELLANQKLKGYRLGFGARGQLAGVLPSGLALLWRVSQEEYHIVVSPPPAKDLLAAVLQPENSLGRLPRAAKALERVNSASVVLFLRPGPLGLLPSKPQQSPEAPVLFSAGKSEQRGFVHVEVPAEVITAFATNHE